ncbi:MAG: Asp-tRNA(Asn)/Glu-tRNA(Gln) amidotransferase subunit GatC [Patescibacteria group bacterium]
MISKEQVEHVAKLARIELTEKEKEKFAGELSSILDYVDKLSQVDTSKVEPVSQVTGLERIMREDEIRKEKLDIHNKLIKKAPAKKDNYFKVPKILE